MDAVTPPTWRALAARARRLGVNVDHGRHEASLFREADAIDCRFTSWTGSNAADSIILRTAVAAALEQLEARR